MREKYIWMTKEPKYKFCISTRGGDKMNQIEEVIEYLKVKIDEVETPDEYNILMYILKYMKLPYIVYKKDVLVEFEIAEISSYKAYRELQEHYNMTKECILSEDEWTMLKEGIKYGKKNKI